MGENKQLILSAVIGAVGGIGVAMFSYKSSVIDNNVSAQAVAYDRIRFLEEKDMQQQGEIAELKAIVAMLEAELRFGPDLTPMEALLEFVEAFPLPAWLKRWDRETQQFVMVGINARYANFYGVTQDAYEGVTDFDVHPEEMAQSFYANDMRVLIKKGSDRFAEVVRKANGQIVELTFYKFYIDLPDGTELIAGVQVES